MVDYGITGKSCITSREKMDGLLQNFSGVSIPSKTETSAEKKK